MATHVIGGFHSGAAFQPGAASQHDVEAQIAEARESQREDREDHKATREEKRAEGRRRDQMETGFRMIAERRQKKWNLG